MSGLVWHLYVTQLHSKFKINVFLEKNSKKAYDLNKYNVYCIAIEFLVLIGTRLCKTKIAEDYK